MCTADDIRDTTANLPITHCAAKAPHFVGYTVTETTVDRNCLFYVLSHQLLSVSGVAKSATCVRQETVEFLRTSPAANNELLVSGIDPDHYLAQMEKDGTWGDRLMLSAAATLYRVSIKIKILMEDGSAFVICNEAVEDRRS